MQFYRKIIAHQSPQLQPMLSLVPLKLPISPRPLLMCKKKKEGFCTYQPISNTVTNAQPLYQKVTNPTFSPSHLQDLMGFTRSVYKKDHAVITPEGQVFSPLPLWTDTLGAYLITPAMGSNFIMYLAKMHKNSESGSPPSGVERFVFVVNGSAVLHAGTSKHNLTADSYAYFSPTSNDYLKSVAPTTLVVFERRNPKSGGATKNYSTGKAPPVETPGDAFKLTKLFPTSGKYDFNIHIMDFQPGAFLNVKEFHHNQHGLLLLDGQGICRLGDSWYPVQADDAIWIAPYVPQWYAALGKSPSRFLLYKDVANPM